MYQITCYKKLEKAGLKNKKPVKNVFQTKNVMVIYEADKL